MSTALNSSTDRRRRFTLLGALGATVGVLLAGCGSGPAQAGSAAIVGDVKIPLEHVQQRLDVVLKKEPAAEEMQRQRKLDQVARQIVTLSVQHELIEAAAKREGVTVDENLVTEMVDNAGGAELASQNTVYDANTFRERARDQLVQVELGRKYADKLEITFDYFFTKDNIDAIAKAKQIAANPAKMEEFVQAGAQGTDGRVQAELRAKVSSSESPQFAQSLLFGVKPGTVVAFPPNNDNAQWMVAYVHERKTDARPSGDSSVEQLTAEILGGIGLRMIQPLADELQVKVNPRYGVWDSAEMAVAPSEKELKGFQAPVRKSAA